MPEKITVKNWDGDPMLDPCSLYNKRLDWLERQILLHRSRNLDISEEQYQRWYDDEYRTYQNAMRDKEGIDRLDQDFAIIVPTHFYHVRWLRTCLESCRKTGLFILVCYDNPFHSPDQRPSDRMPTVRTMLLADTFFMKQKTWGSGVGIPHAWNMVYGLRLLQSLGFKYVFNINGDCFMEKPEGLQVLMKTFLEGSYDCISAEYIPEKKYCATISWLAKMDVAVGIWNLYMKQLYHFNIGNAEARMGRYLIEGNYKVMPVENPEDAHFKPPGVKGTWRHVLGFRHLHAEHKVRRTQRMEPIEQEHCECGTPESKEFYMNGHERQTLMKYWQTGDRRYLEAWWG